jgi:hypothetical protein
MMSPRTLKLIAISYAVKTLIFGVAWLVIPDLPQRARAMAVDTWTWVAGPTR